MSSSLLPIGLNRNEGLGFPKLCMLDTLLQSGKPGDVSLLVDQGLFDTSVSDSALNGRLFPSARLL